MTLLKGGESYHGCMVNDFGSSCKDSYLELNVSKTKDTVIDLRRSAPIPKLTEIVEKGVE